MNFVKFVQNCFIFTIDCEWNSWTDLSISFNWYFNNKLNFERNNFGSLLIFQPNQMWQVHFDESLWMTYKKLLNLRSTWFITNCCDDDETYVCEIIWEKYPRTNESVLSNKMIQILTLRTTFRIKLKLCHSSVEMNVLTCIINVDEKFSLLNTKLLIFLMANKVLSYKYVLRALLMKMVPLRKKLKK